MFPFAHDRCGASQQRGTLGCARVFPRFESLCRLFDRAIREFFGGFVKTSDYLRAVCRVDTLEQVAGGDAFTADDKRILASEFALDLLDCIAHPLRDAIKKVQSEL